MAVIVVVIIIVVVIMIVVVMTVVIVIAVLVVVVVERMIADRQAGRDVLVLALVRFFFGGAIRIERRLTIGDGDAVIVGMDFAEGQEAVAIAAIFDEGRLQRRLDARHLGEIDVALDLFFCGSLEIKFFETLAIQYNDPGFFRVRRIDQHALCHS
jgi:hypothetical protein